MVTLRDVMTQTVGHVRWYDNPAVRSFAVPKPVLSTSNKIVVPTVSNTTMNTPLYHYQLLSDFS